MLSEEAAILDMVDIARELKRDLTMALKSSSNHLLSECRDVIYRHKDSMRPNYHEIYQAALLYMQGAISADMDYLYDIAAFGLYLPIESLDNRTIASDPRRLSVLLNRYKDESRHGRLWDMTWLAVLQSCYEPEAHDEAQDAMLAFLSDTWPVIEGSARHHHLWVEALADHPEFLSRDPAGAFSRAWLSDGSAEIVSAAEAIGISPRSWFWNNLTLASLTHALTKPDVDFLPLIPSLIASATDMRAGGKEALAEIMRRYTRMQETPLHHDLMAAALAAFGDPRGRDVGNSAWKIVQEESWLLVLGWMQEERARRLFECLSAQQSGMGGDRLSAWLRYVAWNRSLHGPNCRERLKRADNQRLMALEDDILSGEALRDRMEEFLSRVSAHVAGA